MRRFKSALPGVTIRRVALVTGVNDQLYAGDGSQVNHHEFAIQVAGVGSFYARQGKQVEYSVEPGADEEWVKLCLNGQVLVALLHQRGIISFHASSFVHSGRGVMILGESGAGKSSLTASFVLEGATFLSDDITPVIFKDQEPCIWPLSGMIRLRDHSVGQLGISENSLTRAEPGSGKHYFRVNLTAMESYLLHTVIKIEVGDTLAPEFYKPDSSESFTLLRSEVCFWEILNGMPATEAEYLHQLLDIVKQVKIFRVVRPADIEISALHSAIEIFLNTELH